ncbi:MAG: hypothetical protein K0U41_06225 [Gammaproteobacteria bacterium]|nr:hypothetical protein [Gammaproteobacteria bacterium]
MKPIHYFLLIIISLFVLGGCEERKPKTKEEIMKSLPKGRDRQFSEGFAEQAAPTNNTGKADK